MENFSGERQPQLTELPIEKRGKAKLKMSQSTFLCSFENASNSCAFVLVNRDLEQREC